MPSRTVLGLKEPGSQPTARGVKLVAAAVPWAGGAARKGGYTGWVVHKGLPPHHRSGVAKRPKPQRSHQRILGDEPPW